jgi:hypothetical protein
MSAAQNEPRTVEQSTVRMTDLVGEPEDAAAGILEAEDALRRVRDRYEQTEDPAAQGELAAEALDHVERQLRLTRERRRQLDSVEGKLWTRRNRLERLLIQTRGASWWQARRRRAARGEAGPAA